VFVALRVRDLESSARFYRNVVGIPLEPASTDPLDDKWIGGEHQEFSWMEGSYLHFALFQAREQPTASAEVGFVVDDLDTVHRRALSSGVPVVHAPRVEPWGPTARYTDPDRNVVGLTERALTQDRAGLHAK